MQLLRTAHSIDEGQRHRVAVDEHPRSLWQCGQVPRRLRQFVEIHAEVIGEPLEEVLLGRMQSIHVRDLAVGQRARRTPNSPNAT